MTIERKTGTAFLKELDSKGSGTAVIATLGVVDKDGDQILSGAFEETVVPVVPAHQWIVPPIGKARVYEKGDEALADFELNLKTELGREWYEALLFDFQRKPSKTEWSFGFSIPPNGAEHRTLEDGRRVRLLKRLQLYEISPVLLGSGIGTRLVALKNASVDREGLLAYLQSLSREQQEAWMTQAQALCTEAHVLLLDVAFDDLMDDRGKEQTGAFRYKFTTLPVEDSRRQAATAGLIAVVAELQSKEPYLRFFTEAEAGGPWDFAFDRPLIGASNIPAHPDVIAVHEKLAPSQTFETVVHEVCHFARPGLSEAKVEEFSRELARANDPRPALVPVPMFVSAAEARELRKHQTVHYSPALNAEFVLAMRAVPTRSLQPKAMAETAPGLVPLSGRPIPGFSY